MDCRGNAQGARRGRGFVPGRSGSDVGPCTSVLLADAVGADRAGLAPIDGRKRLISSPPLQRPSHGKKSKLQSDSGQCSHSDRDDTS